MKYHDTCPHCGHKTTAYTLPLNEGLVRAFLTFKEARVRLGRPVKKGELGLTNSQYGNFQNLRHFGLIMQTNGKGRDWEMTFLGWDFVTGRKKILNPAGHLGGVTLAEDHLAWSTHPKRRELVSIFDVLPADYKQRPEYQEEKAGAA